MRTQLLIVLMTALLGFGGDGTLAQQSVSAEAPSAATPSAATPSAETPSVEAPKTGAEKPAAVGRESATDKAAIRQRVAEWLKTCLGDWDRATHMTKQEWRKTCERVASERGNYLLENPLASTMLLEGTRDRSKR
jgi:hypothetical protein